MVFTLGKLLKQSTDRKLLKYIISQVIFISSDHASVSPKQKSNIFFTDANIYEQVWPGATSLVEKSCSTCKDKDNFLLMAFCEIYTRCDQYVNERVPT